MNLTQSELEDIKKDLEKKKGILAELKTKHAVYLSEKEKLVSSLKEDFGIENPEAMVKLIDSLSDTVKKLISDIKSNMQEADEILLRFDQQNTFKANQTEEGINESD